MFTTWLLKHHGDDVLPMSCTSPLTSMIFALGLTSAPALQQQHFSLDVGQQMRHGLFRHAGAFHHLRQNILP
jgi:hypothetical protein